MPAVIVGTLDSADEILWRLGLHRLLGSASGALPAGPAAGAGISARFLHHAVAAVHVFSLPL